MKTKDKILGTAQKLFFMKGIDRTSIKEIADLADINIAAVNYHFRSKENLIDVIFEKIISSFSPDLPYILESDLPLEKKLRSFIDALTDLLLKYNPHLPFFIMSILQRNPKKILKLKIFAKLYAPDSLYKHLATEIENGTINKIDSVHFFMTILSLIGFPFAMQHVLMGVNGWIEKEFENFIIERKEMIFQMAMDMLKGEKKDYIP